MAEVARRQGGVVSVAQLRAAGLDADAVAWRVRAGRLHPLGRGVYAVGHTALGSDGLLNAAVLGVGEGAVVSHRSAADLWGFALDSGRIVDVLTTARGRTPWPAVRLHKTRDLPPQDVTRRNGIPVTSVHRTLVDLSAVLDARRLERAVHEAEVLRLLDVAATTEVLERSRGRRGTGRLRELIRTEAPPTRTELERLFLTLCRSARLPRPEVNVIVHGYEVDFLWRDARLIAETDGRAVHDTAKAFERDRKRDIELTKQGFTVVRFTWRHVKAEPKAVAADLAELLRLRC
jgi:very-short-patch-repair endonuclease